jgi:preprotein translocase subunit YajC
MPPVFISQAYAQAAPAPAAAPDSFLGSLGSMLPLVLMFVVLYFVMIRPQMKRQKEHKAMIDALAKGDEVVTGGGLIGRVSKLGESYLHVEVANGVELQVQRTASSRCCRRARSSKRVPGDRVTTRSAPCGPPAKSSRSGLSRKSS